MISAGHLFGGRVLPLMGHDTTGVLGDAVSGHPPDLGLICSRLPPAAGLMAPFGGVEDGPRELES